MFMPFQILWIWFRGLLAVALIGLGAYLLKEWYDARSAPVVQFVPLEEARVNQAQPQVREVRRNFWRIGFDRETAFLLGGATLLLLSVGGGSRLYPYLYKSEGTPPKSAAEDAPDASVTTHRLMRPDGSELHVACLGPVDAPPIVLNHGWSVNSSEWKYSEQALAKTHRVILWDLPGLGRSSRPKNNDFSLETMARDLDAVLDLANGRPAVVVGHSIGGMIALTYARMFPDKLGHRIAGLVLTHTTYTNPARTAKGATVLTLLQKPVLEPLCYVMIGLAPIVWVINWMSYFNGSLHRSSAKSSFAGTETREQLDLVSRYGATAWPGVVARGMLAMFKYDATAALPTINVPVLVVTGDEDTLTPPEASTTMAETIPGASLQPLKPAKHMGHMEHHVAFASAVNAFVDECNAKTPSRASSASR